MKGRMGGGYEQTQLLVVWTEQSEKKTEEGKEKLGSVSIFSLLDSK